MTWKTILSGFSEISNIIVAVCTIITVILALITIKQTNKQIKISNKHQLFEKRIAGYTLLQETTRLYALYKDVLQDKSQHLLVIPHETFAALTNNTSLSGLHQLAYKEATGQDVVICQRVINPIVCEATNLKFLFSQTDAVLAAEFLQQYIQLCTILYQLRIDNESIRLSNSEQADELMLFEYERYNTADVLAKLRKAYDNLQSQNVLKHMEEEISLICKRKQEVVTKVNTDSVALTRTDVTDSMIDTQNQIKEQQQQSKTECIKANKEAWNKLIQYEKPPENAPAWLRFAYTIHNTLAVFWHAMWITRKDIGEAFVLWNCARQTLINKLRTRKWGWYLMSAYMLACFILAFHSFMWPSMIFCLLAMIVFFARGRTVRIAMFEVEKLTNHEDIGILLSIYTAKSDHILTIISIIVSLVTVYFTPEVKTAIANFLQTT